MMKGHGQRVGFRLLGMNMSDGETGKLVWDSGSDDLQQMKEVHVPREILRCKVVSRELTFGTHEEIKNLRVLQRVTLHGCCVEEWNFRFGYVIPDSTNTWQTTVQAAPQSEMLPPEMMSGNVTLHTIFKDNDTVLFQMSVVLFYD